MWIQISLEAKNSFLAMHAVFFCFFFNGIPTFKKNDSGTI